MVPEPRRISPPLVEGKYSVSVGQLSIAAWSAAFCCAPAIVMPSEVAEVMFPTTGHGRVGVSLMRMFSDVGVSPHRLWLVGRVLGDRLARDVPRGRLCDPRIAGSLDVPQEHLAARRLSSGRR